MHRFSCFSTFSFFCLFPSFFPCCLLFLLMLFFFLPLFLSLSFSPSLVLLCLTSPFFTLSISLPLHLGFCFSSVFCKPLSLWFSNFFLSLCAPLPFPALDHCLPCSSLSSLLLSLTSSFCLASISCLLRVLPDLVPLFLSFSSFFPACSSSFMKNLDLSSWMSRASL